MEPHVSTLLIHLQAPVVESKHVAPLLRYIFNITTVVFDGASPPFISQTLRDGTPQVYIFELNSSEWYVFCTVHCNIIIQYKQTKCTYFQLIFQFLTCDIFYTIDHTLLTTSLLKNKVVINSSFPAPHFVLTRNCCLRHHVRSWNSFLSHTRNVIKYHSYCDTLHVSNLFDRFAVRRPNEESHNCAH